MTLRAFCQWTPDLLKPVAAVIKAGIADHRRRTSPTSPAIQKWPPTLSSSERQSNGDSSSKSRHPEHGLLRDTVAHPGRAARTMGAVAGPGAACQPLTTRERCYPSPVGIGAAASTLSMRTVFASRGRPGYCSAMT